MIHTNIFKKTYALALAMSIICCVSPLAFLTSSVNNDNHNDEITQDDLKDLAMEIAVMVNEARAENGLQPLYVVPNLCDRSQVRVREAVHKFSHYRPTQTELSGGQDESEEGEWFSTVIDKNLTPYLDIDENLAAAEDPCSAAEAFGQWRDSEEHWNAILNPNMTHMGVAVTYEHKDRNTETFREDPYEWYWELLLLNVEKDFYAVDDPDNPGKKKRVFVDKELDGQYLPNEVMVIPKSTGDLSGDGVIDSFDFITIEQYIAYQDELKKAQEGKAVNEEILAHPVTFNKYQIEAADCFKDGVIDSDDAYLIKRYVLGQSISFPVTTKDELREIIRIELQSTL